MDIMFFMVQVNQWLTWLETAEEEESEDEDYWGTGQSHVLSGCSDFFTLYFLLSTCPFLHQPNFSPLLFIFSNHCYKFHYELFSQIKPASPSYCTCAFLISFFFFNLVWCPTADVLYISILGNVFFDGRQYCAGNYTSNKTCFVFITFLHLEEVTKCCHNC